MLTLLRVVVVLMRAALLDQVPLVRSIPAPPLIRATGAKHVAVACSNCKRQLMQLMEYHKESVSVGGVHGMLSRSILIDGKAAGHRSYE